MHVTMGLLDTTLKMTSRSPPLIAGISSPAPVKRHVRATAPKGRDDTVGPSPASLRWRILRRALPLSHRAPLDDLPGVNLDLISRRSRRGFNLIPWEIIDDPCPRFSRQDIRTTVRDVYIFCHLPVEGNPSVFLVQRAENGLDLNDVEVSIRLNIDSTGVVCQWPSEDVLAYFCLNHAHMFRSKRVLELGSGYGMAVFAIATCTDALEVVISDGNRQVVDYIQRNIHANKVVFGNTKVMSLALRWDETEAANIGKVFDIIIASDCTFFKECHEDLVLTVKFLLKSSTSEALFFSPQRGDSLDKFLMKIEEIGLQFTVTEKHDEKVWHLHTKYQNSLDFSWPKYDPDHCYPVMVRITL